MCPWNRNTLHDAAVLARNMTVVAGAVENGCPSGRATVFVRIEHVERIMVEYL